MEEINISRILGAILYYDELNSKTMEYRINNFIYACGFDLNNDKCEKTMFKFENGYQHGLIFNRDEENECVFLAKRKYDSKRKDYLYMEGRRKDLEFVFNNYYGKKKIDKRVIDLPFDIYLKKKINDDEYKLIINTLTGIENKFVISKNDNQELCFYANILDFSKILKIVKSFVINPEFVLNAYIETRNEKRISFVYSELNKAIETDDKFEKPGNKFVKKLRMITNND